MIIQCNLVLLQFKSAKIENINIPLFALGGHLEGFLIYNKMKITKKQVRELYESKDVEKLKEWFPEFFEKKVTGWFKCEQSYGNWYGYYLNNILQYIINDDGFSNITAKYTYQGESKATQKEVETALINEAKKRYNIGDKIKRLENFYYGFNRGDIIDNLNFIVEDQLISIQKNNGFYLGLFKNGIWAEIITQKMTKEQAEKEFNINIID